jgi:hypothetical protein
MKILNITDKVNFKVYGTNKVRTGIVKEIKEDGNVLIEYRKEIFVYKMNLLAELND